MDEQRHIPHADERHPEVQHEEHDINVRAAMWFVVIFVVTGIVIHVALWFLYKGFASLERRRTDPPVTLVSRPDRQLPPGPRLQPFPEKAPVWQGAQQTAVFRTPVDDMKEMRELEERQLHGYGWVDPKQGRVRIPIELAMELVLQRGLPVREQPQPVGTTP